MDKPNYSVWTDKDEKFLIRNYGVMTSDDIAKHLGRDRQGIIGKANRLRHKGVKIYGKCMDAKQWTKEEEIFVKDNYGKMKLKDIVSALNTSHYFVYEKAKELNLKEKSKVRKELGQTIKTNHIKTTIGKEYEIYKCKLLYDKQKKTQLYFRGKSIYEDNRFIVLQKDITNIRETFLKIDIAIGEYKLKEEL